MAVSSHNRGVVCKDGVCDLPGEPVVGNLVIPHGSSSECVAAAIRSARLGDTLMVPTFCARHHAERLVVELGRTDLTIQGPTAPTRLEQMLDGMTPENRHGEIDFGRPVGREFPNEE